MQQSIYPSKSSFNSQEIYLAGGCFWGTEAYFKRVPGVLSVEVGYANGKTVNPSYQEVCEGSGHAEVVRVIYDADCLSLHRLLLYYFRVIDPTSLNQQGNDRGIQYRTGIYFTNPSQQPVIEHTLAQEQKRWSKPIVVEVKLLENYYKAEDYHQDYLDKNPQGYCHINIFQADIVMIDPDEYHKPSQEQIRQQLSPLAYEITQNAATERAFTNAYWDFFEPGVYVDVISGEPLFSSEDKFASQCGWPSFARPIAPEVVRYYRDNSHGMQRIEVKARVSEAHLGHVFEDGPQYTGGLRYCINGATLRFIPVKDLEAEGYAYLKDLFVKIK